jgi:hypothetical protein
MAYLNIIYNESLFIIISIALIVMFLISIPTSIFLNRFFKAKLDESDKIKQVYKVVSGISNRIVNQAFVLIFLFLALILITGVPIIVLYWVEHPISFNFVIVFLNASIYCFVPLSFILFTFVVIEAGFKSFKDNEDLKGLQYEKWGSLSWWSKANNRFNHKKRWIERVYSQLASDGVFNIGKKIRLLSPSANAAHYEKFIAEELTKIKEFVRFICSDKVKGADRTGPVIRDNLVFTYDEGIDAADIVAFLEKKDEKQVDIIWDIKGFVWHTIEAVSEKEEKIKTLEHIFNIFDRVLTSNGCIVIDAYQSKKRVQLCNQPLVRGFGIIFGYAEMSTDSYIHHLYDQSNLLRNLYERTYSGKGIYRMAIYRKRGEDVES